MRFLVNICVVAALVSVLFWLAGGTEPGLVWPALLFAGLGFLGWADGAPRRRLPSEPLPANHER